MTKEAKAALKIAIEILSNLTRGWKEEEARSEFLEQLARDARKTGLPQSHRACEAPLVYDATPSWDRLRKLIKTSEYKELQTLVNCDGGIEATKVDAKD